MGLLDVLAVFVGASALARLRALRLAGKLTVRAWVVVIEEQAQALRARLRGGIKKTSDLVREPQQQPILPSAHAKPVPAPTQRPKIGKAKNKLELDPKAQGDHTTFERDNNGDVYKYETYEKTPSGHNNPKERYDGGKPDGSSGAPHVNKQTKKPVPTPHVQGKKIPGGVRPAYPHEIPKKKPKI